jgi:hypothetical protein
LIPAATLDQAAPGEETWLADHVKTGAPSITDPAAVTPILLL